MIMSNKVTNEWVLNSLLNPTPIPTSILNPGVADKENVPTKSTTTVRGTNVLYLALPGQEPKFVGPGGVPTSPSVPSRKAVPASKPAPVLAGNSNPPNSTPQPVDPVEESEEETEEEEDVFIPFDVAAYVNKHLSQMQ